VWKGAGWGAHWESAAALVVTIVACSALATKIFRWE